MRALGVISFVMGAEFAGMPPRYATAEDVRIVPVVTQAAQQPPAKPDDKQVPRVPETVVPGERTPTEAMPESAPSETGGLSQDPFNSSGASGIGVDGPFLPDVQGTRINAGKKTRRARSVG